MVIETVDEAHAILWLDAMAEGHLDLGIDNAEMARIIKHMMEPLFEPRAGWRRATLSAPLDAP